MFHIAARTVRRSWLSRIFDFSGVGAITRRLCLQAFDGLVVTHLER
jgi:hypothetical protein